ncbi:hypothetical protein [Chitinophaga sp. CF418]|uniref:hypothetical protein n=1 Tax=Chitinophaga sp. CF418 TaxID=1855287 RepID=UPI0009195A05|nr:hypothetical protein [Chitinophaga sp. CF418]SHN46179.1 YD repeat-containing protein [Chitinophaga sp. CF418]
MKKIIFAIIVLSFTRVNITVAQEKNPVIPLPPNAAELFKYNSIPVSPMTGVPDISYPIYEINTGKIKLPVTLSYHASGIKVSQRATWVGLGWSLMPGANISRAVRGIEDEKETYGWFNHHSSVDTLGLIKDYWTMNAWYTNSPDRQPDFFSYNIPGKSGKFIFSRESGSFLNFPYQPVQIKRISDANNFEITDDDGTKYIFGQTQSVTDDNFGIRTNVQSWFLTQIISNDSQDTVFLKYNDNSVSGSDLSEMSTASSTVVFNSRDDVYNGDMQKGAVETAGSSVIYSPAMLSEILFRQGKVTFYSKGVRNDQGTSLDSVVVYTKEGSAYKRLKKVSFQYGYFFSGSQFPSASDYRLKLLSFSKEGISGEQPEMYKFEYNSIQPPSAYSFSVDYFGFYNGAINGDLMPNILPVQENLKTFGTLGYANREPSTAYMMAGMLEKIIYPTGGYSILSYEPNQWITSQVSDKEVTLGSFQMMGKGVTAYAWDSTSFTVTSPLNSSTHPATVRITLTPYSPNAKDVAQKVTLRDVTEGRDLQVWTSDLYPDYQNPHTIEQNYQFDVTHIYRIIGVINDVSTTKITVGVVATMPDTSTLIKSGGGIRVNSVSSYNIDNSLQKEDRYTYGINEDGIGYMPVTGDDIIYNSYSAMSFLYFKTDPIGCAYAHGVRITYTANNSYPTVNFQGSPVIYSSVTRYEMGNGKPNGKTLLQYEMPKDYISLPAPGSIGGKEIIDNSMSDVNLQSEHIYRANVDGSYTLLKQTINNYTAITTPAVSAAIMWHRYMVEGGWCPAPLLDEFGYMTFSIKTGGSRIGSTEETIFDENGNIQKNTVLYEYNKLGYPKTIKRTNSRNDTLSAVMYFPGEHASTVSDAAVLTRMVKRNMVRQPYWQGSYSKNILLKYNRTLFSDQWSANDSLIMPKADSIWSLGSTQPELAVAYQGYDKYGNILQLTERNGITSSYSWNANNSYPVSQTIGAASASVLYDGFEDAGSWTGVVRDNGQARTGGYAGLITNTGSYVNPRWTSISLTAATKFKYSGWVYSNGPGAIINLLMKRSGETGAYSYIDNISVSQSGKWIYVEKEYLVPADVKSMSIRLDNNGTGKVWFDDIKLRPSLSQMNSFTYLPLIGVTSKSDDQNHMLKYEYDGLGRLKVIRDQDGNVLKQIDYQYQAPLTK